LDAHQEGDLRNAVLYFSEALTLDPANTTAQYNLACALARGGHAKAVVGKLQLLEPTAALRLKIEKDGDFDGVRQDPEFRSFVEGLPAE
jgi:cytochrome c-type biogenesis protein CcmH/NrfG